MAKPVKDEPRALLRDLQILGERRAGDALRMIGDHPNRHVPLAERQFRVAENRTDLDREAGATVAALEVLAVGKMVDARAAAVGAKLAVPPADFPQMIEASLFVGEGVEEIKETGEIGDHGYRSCSIAINLGVYVTRVNGSYSYIGPLLFLNRVAGFPSNSRTFGRSST